MNLLESLRKEIAGVLATEKTHTVTTRCLEMGLADGDPGEPYSNKERYVYGRLTSLDKDALIAVAKRVLAWRSTYQLEEALEYVNPSREGTTSAITRRHIIDDVTQMGHLEGKLGVVEFLTRVFPLFQMRSPIDSYTVKTLQDYVHKHMVENQGDWTYKDFFDFVQFLQISESRFRFILEEIVHPEVRTGDDQQRFIAAINAHLTREGLQLLPTDDMSGYLVYTVIRRDGVSGTSKNLIFAASGPKPEIVLSDALNNDLKIVRNQEYCLVYDRPISRNGLRWIDLIRYWAEIKPSSEDPERTLYARLLESLSSPPEKRFFRYYFEILRPKLKDELPALVPQVYLHYDPYTLRDLPDGSALARQRMDFLLLASGRQRIVIEIDGEQHYSKNDKPSPRLYAEMVAEDRNLRLQGYEIFRFGGYEVMGDRGKEIVTSFLERLVKKLT
jgi:hypothetical protein